MNAGESGHKSTRLRVLFRWNATAFAVVSTILIAANIYTGGGVWSFWPLFVWGTLLALHFFIVNSIDVDEKWVTERVDQLHYRSYDQGHIDDIGKRVDECDASVRPADERE